MTEIELKEGWGVIAPGDRLAHYYREAFSLCQKRGFYRGPLEVDDFKSKDDCTACRKILEKEKSQLRVTEVVHDTRICTCEICMKWKTEHRIKDDGELK